MDRRTGWEGCEEAILELHRQGPPTALMNHVIDLAEAGDPIARDVLRDAANTQDPAAQRRARGGLDIIQNEASKIAGYVERVPESQQERAARSQRQARRAEKIRHVVAELREWMQRYGRL
jgi:hypothetical protein